MDSLFYFDLTCFRATFLQFSELEAETGCVGKLKLSRWTLKKISSKNIYFSWRKMCFSEKIFWKNLKNQQFWENFRKFQRDILKFPDNQKCPLKISPFFSNFFQIFLMFFQKKIFYRKSFEWRSSGLQRSIRRVLVIFRVVIFRMPLRLFQSLPSSKSLAKKSEKNEKIRKNPPKSKILIFSGHFRKFSEIFKIFFPCFLLVFFFFFSWFFSTCLEFFSLSEKIFSSFK